MLTRVRDLAIMNNRYLTGAVSAEASISYTAIHRLSFSISNLLYLSFSCHPNWGSCITPFH